MALYFLLTLILEPKMICLFYQYRARLVGTSLQSDQALYYWLTNVKYLSQKMKMDSPKNGKWIIPFIKFSRLRIKQHLPCFMTGYIQPDQSATSVQTVKDLILLVDHAMLISPMLIMDCSLDWRWTNPLSNSIYEHVLVYILIRLRMK